MNRRFRPFSFGVIALLCSEALYAQSVPEQWFTEKTVPGYLAEIESFQVHYTGEREWNREFVRWREEIGHPLRIKHLKSKVEFKFFESPEGFLSDEVWKSGEKITRSEWSNYDNQQWRYYNRYNGVNHLNISTKPNPLAVNGQVLCAQYPPFFEYLFVAGFPLPRERFEDDIAIYNADLAEIKSVPVWKTALQRLLKPVEVTADSDGELCWYLELDGGLSPINEPDTAIYRIWLPFKSPVFAKRIELKHRNSGEFISVLEVKEFIEVTPKAGKKAFLYPSRWQILSYNCHETERGFPNQPYQISNYLLRSVGFNEVDEQIFSQFPEGIRQINNLDTGKSANFK